MHTFVENLLRCGNKVYEKEKKGKELPEPNVLFVFQVPTLATFNDGFSFLCKHCIT